MPMRHTASTLCLSLLATLSYGSTVLAQEPKTSVFINAIVITPQGEREAVAVSDGLIVAIGKREEVTKAAGAAEIGRAHV